MSNSAFKEKYHEEFISNGFYEVDPEENPLTLYEQVLIPQETIEENEIEEDQIPTLFFGTSGINTGFGIFTGACIVWLNVSNPTDAVEVAKKISSFEPIF